MLELSVTSPVLEHFHYLQTRFSAFSMDTFESSEHPFRNHRVTLLCACELGFFFCSVTITTHRLF